MSREEEGEAGIRMEEQGRGGLKAQLSMIFNVIIFQRPYLLTLAPKALRSCIGIFPISIGIPICLIKIIGTIN